jgi:hypothetical protein
MASFTVGQFAVSVARWMLLVLVVAGCRYSLNPDIDPNRDGGGFTCSGDADCGSGWHCNLECQAAGFAPYCLPDSECDACPDLQTDPRNCGGCGNDCGGGDCIGGSCIAPPA